MTEERMLMSLTWYAKIPKPAIVIFTLLVVPASTILAILADINLYAERWPLSLGVMMTQLGVSIAFLALGLPVFPPPLVKRRLYIVVDRMLVVCAALPAILFGIYLAARYSEAYAYYPHRMLLVIVAVAVSVCLRNLDLTMDESQEPSSRARMMDIARQIILVFVTAIGMVIYIYLPAFR
jgi:hypothetical protein